MNPETYEREQSNRPLAIRRGSHEGVLRIWFYDDYAMALILLLSEDPAGHTGVSTDLLYSMSA